MNKIYFVILAIFTCIFGTSLPQGKLTFVNNSEDPLKNIIVVIDAYENGYNVMPGPCFLVRVGQPFIADTHTKDPSGRISIYEHTQFDANAEKALRKCPTAYYNVTPIYQTTIFVTPSDENKEFHYGIPAIQDQTYNQRVASGKITVIPIKTETN